MANPIKGSSPEMGEEWQVVDNPIEHVQQTNGLIDEEIEGSERTEESVQDDNKSLSKERKAKVDEATLPIDGVMSWSVYEEEVAARSNNGSNAN